MSNFLSHDNPILQTEYAPIPIDQPGWTTKREIAHEKVCRDLDKAPEQLLVDTHDESLDRKRRPSETVSRTLARMASMQLRIQKELEKQANVTDELNRRVAVLTVIGVCVAAIGLLFGLIQAVTGVLVLCKG